MRRFCELNENDLLERSIAKTGKMKVKIFLEYSEYKGVIIEMSQSISKNETKYS